MLTVTLQSDIATQLSELADQRHESVDELVDHALRNYMAHFLREKIRQETAAFYQQYQTLIKEYPGDFVAIHNQQVIDHDKNLRDLHLRIHNRLGRMPVLLKQVTAETDHELVFRSPKFENITPYRLSLLLDGLRNKVEVTDR